MTDYPPSVTLTRDRYRRRLAGCVSPRYGEATILIAGGGGGSGLAVDLARLDPKRVIPVDPDTVDPENLCRTAYTVHDLGRPKVAALRDHLRAANPFVQVDAYAERIETVLARFEASAGDALPPIDLIIAGTDQFAAQAAINTWSCRTGTPAVFIGIHRGGLGGIITFQIPGETPCYHCVSRERYRAAAAGGDTQVNLPGAAGTIADISFIDAVALKIAVGLIERRTGSPAGRLLDRVMDRTEVVVRAHPDYCWGDIDPFATVLSDLPTAPTDYRAELERSAYHALDTLWLPTERDPDCPDCRHLFPEVTL